MSLEHVNVSCPSGGCFAIVTLHPDDEERLRRTHESFYCPAGHSMSFQGKTADEKRIAELERVVRNNSHRSSQQHEIRERLVDSLKDCPLGCGWRARRHTQDQTPWGYAAMVQRVRGDIVEHLCSEHGVELPAHADEAVA